MNLNIFDYDDKRDSSRNKMIVIVSAKKAKIGFECTWTLFQRNVSLIGYLLRNIDHMRKITLNGMGIMLVLLVLKIIITMKACGDTSRTIKRRCENLRD